MSKCKNFNLNDWIRNFVQNYLPNSCDNLKQLSIKIIFLLLIVGIVVSGVYFGNYFSHGIKQDKVLNSQREIFENNDLITANEKLHNLNEDYSAWLKLSDTELNNPVFNSRNNSYYLTHNSLKKNSRYGALFFDYRSKSTDQNRVIYGHTLNNGAMFGTLKNLRTLSFYKENSVLEFTTAAKTTNYKIYAVFVLNASKDDDGDYIYNIYRNDFLVDDDFNIWVQEAKDRSVINTMVDVNPQDKILTLVTECDDFDNSRLVVMARSEREGEKLLRENPEATVNSKPRYPKKWYEQRNIKYPF